MTADAPIIDPTEEYVYCVLSGIIEREERASSLAIGDWAVETLNPGSVIDLGCNNGLYLVPFAINGAMTFGVDAIPEPPGGKYCQPGMYRRHDLRTPFYARLGGNKFDLCLCLETLEHIEQQYHETVVKSCVDNSKAVIFSCAVPGQLGQFHKACRSHEEVIDLFEAHGGWKHRGDLSLSLRMFLCKYGAVSPWLIDNALVFAGPEE